MPSGAAHDHLEDLIGITCKSRFVDGWYRQGRAAGEAQGEARGKREVRRRRQLRQSFAS
jgi:hypothetical protein